MNGKTKTLKGRPKIVRDGKNVNVYLGEKEIETAKRLGNGNVSAGVREALKKERENESSCKRKWKCPRPDLD